MTYTEEEMESERRYYRNMVFNTVMICVCLFSLWLSFFPPGGQSKAPPATTSQGPE